MTTFTTKLIYYTYKLIIRILFLLYKYAAQPSPLLHNYAYKGELHAIGLGDPKIDLFLTLLY